MELARVMARVQARRYPRWRDDWESAAYLGLVQAAQMFDPTRGVKFDTFARPRIAGSMLDARRGLGPAGWKRIRLQGPAPRTKTLDCDVADRGASSVGTDLERSDDFDALVRHLYPGERVVIRLRYFEDLSQDEIAQRIGCSQANVSHRHTRGLAVLRERLTPPRQPVKGFA